MEYCFLTNGIVSAPKELPKKHGNVAGGFHKLNDSQLKAYGWYPYKGQKYDPVTHEIVSYKIEKNQAVPVIHPKSLDVATEKEKKIKATQDYVRYLLSQTDMYIIRKVERGLDVPADIAAERARIHAACDNVKSNINKSSDAKSIVNYDYKISNLKYHKM